jgi:hypothetical protein
VLLAQELGLAISRAASLKLRMPAEHETRLTQWMNENARVVWSTCAAPWEVEDHLIQGNARLPLNIRGSSDPFAEELSKLRSNAAV